MEIYQGNYYQNIALNSIFDHATIYLSIVIADNKSGRYDYEEEMSMSSEDLGSSSYAICSS